MILAGCEFGVFSRLLSLMFIEKTRWMERRAPPPLSLLPPHTHLQIQQHHSNNNNDAALDTLKSCPIQLACYFLPTSIDGSGGPTPTSSTVLRRGGDMKCLTLLFHWSRWMADWRANRAPTPLHPQRSITVSGLATTAGLTDFFIRPFFRVGVSVCTNIITTGRRPLWLQHAGILRATGIFFQCIDHAFKYFTKRSERAAKRESTQLETGIRPTSGCSSPCDWDSKKLPKEKKNSWTNTVHRAILANVSM